MYIALTFLKNVNSNVIPFFIVLELYTSDMIALEWVILDEMFV